MRTIWAVLAAALLGACASGAPPSPAVTQRPEPAPPGAREEGGTTFFQEGSTETTQVAEDLYRLEVPLSPAGAAPLPYFCARVEPKAGVAVKGVSVRYGLPSPGEPPRDPRRPSPGPRRGAASFCADGVSAEPLVVEILVDRLGPVNLFIDTPYQREERLPIHRGTPPRRPNAP